MTSGYEALFSEAFRVFLLFCRTNSISACARSTGLSQSSVSRHILSLEKLLGTDLVQRKHRPIQLTEEGARLGKALQDEVDTMSGILDEIKRRNSKKPALKIAFIESFERVSRFFIPEMVPHVSRIISFYGSTDHIFEHLQSQAVDIIVTSDSFEGHNYKKTALLRENTLLVIPKQTELGEPDNLEWKNVQFIGCPFISSHFNSNSAKSCDAFFKANGIKINNVIEVDNVGVKLSLIARGLGWGLVPQMSLYQYHDVLSKDVLNNIQILSTPYPKLQRELYAIGSPEVSDHLFGFVVNKLSTILHKIIPDFERNHGWWGGLESIKIYQSR